MENIEDKKRKMLLVVPHQDDEILVGGGTLVDFANSKQWEVYVLYTTEGAGVYEEPFVRMQEAIKALHKIKIPENRIIFLGYGNGWRTEKHIYHAPDEAELVSLRGKRETFALPSHNEFCYDKWGVHHRYTRKNYKNDLLEAIISIKPEVILAVDLDNHEEHMATSLLLDECLELILKKEKEYKPLLLKKFAYDGLWHGVDDYFHIPRIPTLNGKGRISETRNPSLQWEERLRFANPLECNTFLLHNNLINKVIKTHKSQDGWLCATRCINSDNVYWVKRTDNLLLHAKVSTTSGRNNFLNDFKMVDAIDVRNKNTEWGNCTWYPSEDDTEKKIKIEWSEKQKIREIVLYETPEKTDGKIKNIKILIEGNTILETGQLRNGGRANRYQLPNVCETNTVEIIVSEIEGKSGLSEIEIFSELFELEKYQLPMHEWKEENTNYVVLRKIINWVERKLFLLKAKVLLK